MQKFPILFKKSQEEGNQYWQIKCLPVCECEINLKEGRLFTQEEYDQISGHSDGDNQEYGGEIVVMEWSQEGKRIKQKNPKRMLVIDFEQSTTEAGKLWTQQYYKGFDPKNQLIVKNQEKKTKKSTKMKK